MRYNILIPLKACQHVEDFWQITSDRKLESCISPAPTALLWFMQSNSNHHQSQRKKESKRMFSPLDLHILNKLMLHVPVKFTSTYKIFVQFKQIKKWRSVKEIQSSWCETVQRFFNRRICRSTGQWLVFNIHFKLLNQVAKWKIM